MTGKQAFDRKQHETLGNHMWPKLGNQSELLATMDIKANWEQTPFLSLGRIARSCLEQVHGIRKEVRDVLPELDELAGRQAIRRAARGEEYDPMTGELVKVKPKKRK